MCTRSEFKNLVGHPGWMQLLLFGEMNGFSYVAPPAPTFPVTAIKLRVAISQRRECKACLAWIYRYPEHREVNLDCPPWLLDAFGTSMSLTLRAAKPKQIGCPADLSVNPCRNDGVLALC